MTTAQAVAHIRKLTHRDEEYLGDHWATGNCPRCNAEIALGVRDPRVGGLTLADNRRYVRMLEAS